MPNERPWQLAKAILTAIEDGYAAEAVELPARRFVSDRRPAFVDELVSVHLVRMYGVAAASGPALEQLDTLRCTNWRAAQFEVCLIRCAPSSEPLRDGSLRPPKVDALEASARAVMLDAMLVTDSIVAAYRRDEFGIGPNLALDSWVNLDADGLFVGGRLNVRIGLV